MSSLTCLYFRIVYICIRTYTDETIFLYRGASFKEDEGTWKGNDDGKVVNNQPQRVMDDRNGLGPQGGYIAKITNDARETEMEENMGQVNTMIGNLRNMAIDMGSELENQNRQIDRINRKVRERVGLEFEKSHEIGWIYFDSSSLRKYISRLCVIYLLIQ